MYTHPLLSLALLSLPLLSSAVPQGPPVNNPAPANPQVAPQQPQANPTPTTTLSPDQRNAQYDANYASLASAALTDPNYLAFATGISAASIPVTVVSQQEASYILALKTATASIPEPAYITNLPEGQQSWIRSFHQQLAGPTPAASAPSGVLPPMPSSSSANGTPVSGQSGAPTPSVVNGSTVPASSVSGSPTDTATNAQVPPPPAPTATVDAGNGTNGTNDTSGAMGMGEGRGGLLGMGAMGLLGVVAVMVLL
ncbi:MAG: hypothetical protein Q9171_003185 [Xanthocarpia ochracea]